MFAFTGAFARVHWIGEPLLLLVEYHLIMHARSPLYFRIRLWVCDDSDIHKFVLIHPRDLLMLITLLIGGNSYIVDSYSDFAASAIAAKTFLRSIIGAMIPLFVNQMFHGLGFQYAGLLVAMVAVLISPIPFVFYKYGEGIRLRSARASKAVRQKTAAKELPDEIGEKRQEAL